MGFVGCQSSQFFRQTARQIELCLNEISDFALLNQYYQITKKKNIPEEPILYQPREPPLCNRVLFVAVNFSAIFNLRSLYLVFRNTSPAASSCGLNKNHREQMTDTITNLRVPLKFCLSPKVFVLLRHALQRPLRDHSFSATAKSSEKLTFT